MPDGPANNPSFNMCFTLTSASWPSLVGRRFRDITGERLRRSVFIGAPALAAAIDGPIAHHHTQPKPFIRVEGVADLPQKVNRTSSRLSSEPNAARHGPVRKTGRRSRTGA